MSVKGYVQLKKGDDKSINGNVEDGLPEILHLC